MAQRSGSDTREGQAAMRAILLSGAFALFVSLLGTRVAINQFRRLGLGQQIRDDGPTSHHTKLGTPTMGGVVVILATVVGYFVAKLVTMSAPTGSALLLLFLFVGLGAVGFLDDYIKIARQRSLGLRSKAKMIGQTVVALVFGGLAAVAVARGRERPHPGVEAHLVHPRLRALRAADRRRDAADLVHRHRHQQRREPHRRPRRARRGRVDDGLRRLHAGQHLAEQPVLRLRQARPGQRNLCYTVRDPLDLAVVAAALTGACFGFLWWNASPAAIFMGDTGSLALGGAVAGLAILTRTELLLVILGGLFVLETLSVVLQVTCFKVTKRLTGTGRRIFRIAPIHHHFEMLGWEQVTVTIRFWIITGICVAAGLGIFYAEWVAGIG